MPVRQSEMNTSYTVPQILLNDLNKPEDITNIKKKSEFIETNLQGQFSET